MSQPASQTKRPRNLLLRALSPNDFSLIADDLHPIKLPVRHVLERANKPIAQVYFLESGFVSVVTVGVNAKNVEVGLIGREGMSGIPVIMGDDRSPNDAYMQAEGSGLRISANRVRDAVQKSATLRRTFLQFAHAFTIQTSQTASANASGKIQERLARWILMAQDRLERDELPLTHEFLALMLGIRRAGVTVALQKLKRAGVIKAGRGHVVIRDVKGLRNLAHSSYGIPEAAYARMMGFPFDKLASDVKRQSKTIG